MKWSWMWIYLWAVIVPAMIFAIGVAWWAVWQLIRKTK
ncbi:hypothetical protein VT03_21290 [Planctomyces sp. SH-PL14]|nr:hypothetical protein VT03_21290 [Planctomyces sp. SH-PL14]